MKDFESNFTPFILVDVVYATAAVIIYLIVCIGLFAYISSLREQVSQLREREARNQLWDSVEIDDSEYDFLLDDPDILFYQPLTTDPAVIRRRIGLS